MPFGFIRSPMALTSAPGRDSRFFVLGHVSCSLAYLFVRVDRAYKKTMEQGVKQSVTEAKTVRLLDLIDYQDGAVVSREVLRKKTGTITLFAFDEEQGLSEHTTAFDALANVLEGELEITISGDPLRVKQGEMVIMPAGQPHAVNAIKKSKMLLIMIRS
jgi:quercetin dioxygenase-like cupin family protein